MSSELKRPILRAENGINDSIARESDDALIRRFATTRDEAAFRELVERHAALVLGVARRVIVHEQDAEEVLQATFIVLSQKAKKLKPGMSLANWLYGVAYRISLRARSKKSRRREMLLPEISGSERTELEQLAATYEQQLLDDELNKLPKQYREPLVLHYLMGKTCRIVAEELGLTERTVEGRLRRGRRELRHRLIKRGVSLGALMTAVAITHRELEASVSTPVIESVVESALNSDIGTIGSEPALLARKEILTMTATKTFVPVGFAAIALVGTAIVMAAPQKSDSSLGQQSPSGKGDRSILSLDTSLAQETNEGNISSADSGFATSRDSSQGSVLDRGASDASLFGNVGNVAAQVSASERISNELRKKTQLDFIDAPLVEVVEVLTERHGIPIQFDNAALKANKAEVDAPVTRSLRDVSLASALGLILDEFNLDYMIKHEVLLITSKERVNSTLVTQVYHNKNIGMQGREFADVVSKTIQPETWRTQAAATATNKAPKQVGVIQVASNAVIIRHSSRVHDEIATLIAKLNPQTASSQSRNSGFLQQSSKAPNTSANNAPTSDGGLLDAGDVDIFGN